MKKHDAKQVESIKIYLSKEKTPIAFNSKVEELMNCGLILEDAERFVRTTPFEMEFYYSPNRGLFMVESEAVEATEIFDPYTGEAMEEMDLD